MDFILQLKASIQELPWTTRIGLAGFTSLLLLFLYFGPFYRYMKILKCGEVIRDEEHMGKLRELHAGKRDTVTMGGVLIIASVVPSTLIWAEWSVYTLVGLGVLVGFGLIGFADDLLKVSMRNKRGLDSRFKLLGQAAISVIALWVLLDNPQSANHIRELWIPVTGIAFIPTMPVWLTFLVFGLVLIATSNSVNLTDGVDGLAIGCSISSLLAFGFLAFLAGAPAYSGSINLNTIAGAEEISVLCMALVGAGFGFLWFNGHPAKVFMGDTGSLSLGGVIGIVALMLNQPLILFLIGGIFVIEALSVLLQVASFKLTGKRIFLISPIHHHFEVAGWPESLVVTRFWILSGVFGLVGIWTFTL